ncbi:MAG: alanine/ornithine racemase family PLP-dependent enzyme [Flavipsychrobacter sp.]|nr:alanine/ornithine racemase family PLP-dependent enzyme [Flavipsychrobacter sp.]
MAHITLNTKKLKENFDFLNNLFGKRNIEWSVVTKLLCGNNAYLRAVMDLGITQACDSRIANLKTIKTNYPHIETVFIKPPAERNVRKIVAYADVSFNTSLHTIYALSEAARALGKTHKIVIMIELGELREGVIEDNILPFYEKVFHLPNIEVVGLGTNLTCMYGVLPSYEKLRQLERYRQLIEERFNRKIPYLTGGASVTIPLIERNELPVGINHFRVGETLFFGTDVYNNTVLPGMHQNLFKLYGEIIELYEKPNVPDGELGYNLAGEKITFAGSGPVENTHRAIIDIGLLDIDTRHVWPVDKDIRIAGASSDMTVLDLGANAGHYKAGDKIAFDVDYMGALRLMNSRYIEKRIEDDRVLNRRMQKPAALSRALNRGYR